MFWLNIPQKSSNFICRYLCTCFQNSLSCTFHSKNQRSIFLSFLFAWLSQFSQTTVWMKFSSVSAEWETVMIMWSCKEGTLIMTSFRILLQEIVWEDLGGPSPWLPLLYLPIHIWWETGQKTGSPCIHIALCSCYSVMHTLAFLSSYPRRERNTAESSFLLLQASYWKW